MKHLAFVRLQKTKAAAAGTMAFYKLWFGRWKYVMHRKDREVLLSPEAIADRHRNNKLLAMVVTAWYRQIRSKVCSFVFCCCESHVSKGKSISHS